MFKFVSIFAACFAYVAAGIVHPTAFAAAPATIAYTNAPLYAAGGSQQVDVRQNYDGTFSSYTTNPFGFAAPYSSRYVAGSPATFAAPAKYVATNGFATSLVAGPATYANPAGIASSWAGAPGTYPFTYASPYAAHLAAAAYNAYAASPVSAPVA